MEKQVNYILKYVFVVISILALGMILSISSVKGAETNQNPLLEGIEIDGPDYVFEYEQKAFFTLSKEGYQASDNPEESMEEDPYEKLHYEWSSADENVAKFDQTKYFYQTGCIVQPFSALKRQNFFYIKGGETKIFCTISDDEGNSVTLSKNVTVIKETPIKALRLGKYSISRKELNTDTGVVYTNDIANNLKLKLTLDEGWKLTSEDTVSIDTDNDYAIDIKLKNESLGWEFSYRLNIYRYINHSINLKNINAGCALVTRRTIKSISIRNQAIVIKYNKNADASNKEQFKSGEDLFRKFKEYYGYDDKSVSYKNGILVYKEISGSLPWIYCKNQTELSNAIKNAQHMTPFLFGLGIEGPDTIYAREKKEKFYLSKLYEDKIASHDYGYFKFVWKVNNRKIAKLSHKYNNEILSEKYPKIDYNLLTGVKKGKVIISCTVLNNYGETLLTVSKEVKVRKVCPVKKVKIGNCSIIPIKSRFQTGKVYSNKKKIKIKVTPEKNWKIKKIRVQNGKNINTLKNNVFTMKRNKRYKILITLKNKSTGKTFSYECKVTRYKNK